MPIVRPLLLLALVLPACTWVSKADVEERLDEVDDDGDGVKKALDCNDNDASISPRVDEVWYDGIDQACNGGDDYDQDLDGFVPDAYVGLPTAGVEGSGALPGGDCDDVAPRISPQQPDDWYDGVDQNCDGIDDYDQDADGFVADAYVGLTTQYADGTGTLPGGDCDDGDAEVRPDAQDDWYDGLDSDCDGADDYDQDADGFVPLELYAEYAADGGLLPNGDCDDLDAAIYPDAPDAWYDGVDSDCVGNLDYDADADGFVPSAYASLGFPADDCDDNDPDVYPGAEETLGDLVDSDCVGGEGGVQLDLAPDVSFSGVHSPVFTATASQLYLSVGAEQITTDSGSYYDSAFALVWLLGDLSGGADSLLPWSYATSDPTSYVFSEAFEASNDGSALYGALALTYPSGARGVRPARYDLSSGARIGPSPNSGDARAPYADVGLVLGTDGYVHLVGCEASDGILNYVKWDPSSSSSVEVNDETTGVYASRCIIALDGGVPVIWTAEDTGIVRYDFDATSADPTPTPTATQSGIDAVDMELRDGHLVVADAASGRVMLVEFGAVSETVATAADAVQVDVHEADDGTMFVAWANADGTAVLARSTGASRYTTTTLYADFEIRDVALHSNGDALLVAVVGDDAVAYDVVRY